MSLFEQIKLKIESLNIKKKQLINKLNQINKLKIELAMILISDDYANQVLKGKKNEKGIY